MKLTLGIELELDEIGQALEEYIHKNPKAKGFYIQNCNFYTHGGNNRLNVGQVHVFLEQRESEIDPGSERPSENELTIELSSKEIKAALALYLAQDPALKQYELKETHFRDPWQKTEVINSAILKLHPRPAIAPQLNSDLAEIRAKIQPIEPTEE